MNQKRNSSTDKPLIYRISIAGCLEERWSEWLNGFEIIQENGSPPRTTLTGVIPDQSALRGILTKIWDLNLTLISVNPYHFVVDDR